MVKRTTTLCGILVVAVASTVFAMDRAGDVTPVARRAPSEVAVEGITPQAFFDQQKQLHDWLITEMPQGIEKATISVPITDVDRQNVETPEVVEGRQMPMRVGVVKSLHDRVGLLRGEDINRNAKAANSVMEQSADGGFVWATTLTSPGAVAIRVHFTDFSMPAEAEVYFFSNEGEAYGPYVGTGPNGTGDFWSNSLTSSTGVVLVKYFGTPDADDLAGMSMRISELGHVALDFPRPSGVGGIASFCSFNASCVQNNSCVNEPAVNDAEGAVAKMRWIYGPYIYICSGGLLADTDPSSQIPYFLTANHCMSTNAEASNLEAYFQYSLPCGSTSCSGSFNPAPSPSTLGATVTATGTAGDFTLLTLSETPPVGSIFMGWNNTAVANSTGTDLHRVSHPSGAPQAYSHHQVDASSPTCSGWPRGQRIYSKDIYGATEGGSSGSPVLNAAGEVVGQLSGCCGYNCGNECDSANNWTVDGALAYYWNSVAPYLDPAVGCTTNADCDDGSVCTTDVCNGGSCSNTPITCSDGDACTADSCNAVTGCVFTPITCDDGDACTTDSCSADVGCVFTPITCSGGQICQGGVCVDPPTCGAYGDPCASNADCCSNKCRGRRGTKTCR